MHSKEKQQHKKKPTFLLGKDICKWYIQQRANIQNIKIIYTTQYQKTKESD